MRLLGRVGVVLGIMVLLGLMRPPMAGAIGTCNDPGNLTFNCDFNTFADVSTDGNLRQIPEGWWYWIESGTPAFQVGQDSTNPPSLQVWSDGGSFRVGVYQRVNNVTPGATYLAGIDWAVYTPGDANIMKQIGIDPLGGDNPYAPSVVWSAENYEQNAFMRIRQSAVAQSTSITFFVRVANNGSNGAELAFIDGAWLVEDTSVPPQNVPGPTPTSRPTPSPEQTATAVATVAPPPTEAPVATAPPTTAPTEEPTEIPPSATSVPPSATSVPPSATALLPTATRPLPTATNALPTATRAVATATRPAPSATVVTPTERAVEPTNTARPTLDVSPTRTRGTATPPTRTATATATQRTQPTPRPTSTIEPTVTQFTLAAVSTPNPSVPDAPTDPNTETGILGGLNPLAVGGLGAVVVALSGAAFVMMRQRQL